MDNKLGLILDRLPQFYNKNDSSILYHIISSIVTELNSVQSTMDEINDMIGVDTTYGSDLQSRWGSLLSIKRTSGESDESYRSRLKLSIVTLTGGTKESIKYSIAVGMGINNNPIEMDKRIKVYDGWDYSETIEGCDTYGNIICVVDLNNQIYSDEMEIIVQRSADDVKASGTKVTIIFINYRVHSYSELDDITYTNLNSMKYGSVGGSV